MKPVTGGKRARFVLRSPSLARKLRAGRRYVLEARAGTSRTRLGRAAKRVFRVRG